MVLLSFQKPMASPSSPTAYLVLPSAFFFFSAPPEWQNSTERKPLMPEPHRDAAVNSWPRIFPVPALHVNASCNASVIAPQPPVLLVSSTDSADISSRESPLEKTEHRELVRAESSPTPRNGKRMSPRTTFYSRSHLRHHASPPKVRTRFESLQFCSCKT